MRIFPFVVYAVVVVFGVCAFLLTGCAEATAPEPRDAVEFRRLCIRYGVTEYAHSPRERWLIQRVCAYAEALR